MNEDTIVAIATPIGSGGISIVRISGTRSKEIVSHFCTLPAVIEPRYMYLCDINLGDIVDKGLVVYFVNPNSYTGEDIVEIQCHGGVYVAQKVLDQCICNGARIAENGEFTKRAFVNGKYSLEQAEGIADIISAESDAEARASFGLTSGELYNNIINIQKILTDLLAKIEVSFDYPEHDIEYETAQDVKKSLITIQDNLATLLQTADMGKVIKNGINVVILGKPNVGKSSLLNRLLGTNRAIVTDVAGTTRDVIEDSFVYNGIKINLIDTAGLRESTDEVEKIGIEKAKQQLSIADIVLLIIDGSNSLTQEDKHNLELVDKNKTIIVQNKNDLPQKIHDLGASSIKVSALNNNGITELKQKIYDTIVDKKVIGQNIILTNARHIKGVKDCLNNINNAIDNIDKVSLDCIALDIKQAWLELGKITGNVSDEEIIDKIFSKFCLGK